MFKKFMNDSKPNNNKPYEKKWDIYIPINGIFSYKNCYRNANNKNNNQRENYTKNKIIITSSNN